LENTALDLSKLTSHLLTSDQIHLTSQVTSREKDFAVCSEGRVVQ